jgi:hypothetical protein
MQGFFYFLLLFSGWQCPLILLMQYKDLNSRETHIT